MARTVKPWLPEERLETRASALAYARCLGETEVLGERSPLPQEALWIGLHSVESQLFQLSKLLKIAELGLWNRRQTWHLMRPMHLRPRIDLNPRPIRRIRHF